jgi:hypothetical protein
MATAATPPATPAEEGTQVGVTVAATGWRAYAKLAAYLVCVMAATAAPLADGDGGSVVEWLQVCSAGIAAAGVWVASNTVPGGKYAKTACAAVGTALAVLIPALAEGGEGFTGATGINMLLAVASVIGVWAIPNRTKGGETVLVTAQRAQAALNAPPPAVA